MAEIKLVSLNCPNCGGSLTIGPQHEVFACGYCGANVSVERSGGTISLTQVTDALSKLQRGTDRTAAELALPRLIEEFKVAEGKWKAFQSHTSGLDASYRTRLDSAAERPSGEWIVIFAVSFIGAAVTYAGISVPYLVTHRGWNEMIPKWYFAVMGLSALAVFVTLWRASVANRARNRKREVARLESARDQAIKHASEDGPKIETFYNKAKARLVEARTILNS